MSRYWGLWLVGLYEENWLYEIIKCGWWLCTVTVSPCQWWQRSKERWRKAKVRLAFTTGCFQNAYSPESNPRRGGRVGGHRKLSNKEKLESEVARLFERLICLALVCCLAPAITPRRLLRNTFCTTCQVTHQTHDYYKAKAAAASRYPGSPRFPPCV